VTRNPDPHIYFIRPIGQDGPIKVGHSINVPLRLREYNKWSPLPLEVVAMLPIPDAMDAYGANSGRCSRFERRFHIRYDAHRMHHEWFAAHPTILTDIDNINAGSFDLDCLPEWRKVDNDFIRREYPNGVLNGHTVLRDRAAPLSLTAQGAGTANMPGSALHDRLE
jgi:hypothetical protein